MYITCFSKQMRFYRIRLKTFCTAHVNSGHNMIYVLKLNLQTKKIKYCNIMQLFSFFVEKLITRYILFQYASLVNILILRIEDTLELDNTWIFEEN